MNTLRYGDFPKLFEETKGEVAELLDGRVKLTLGLGGYKGENGGHSVNFVEAAGGFLSFRKCLDPKGEFEDHNFTLCLLLQKFRGGAKGRDMEVEDLCARVLGDVFHLI